MGAFALWFIAGLGLLWPVLNGADEDDDPVVDDTDDTDDTGGTDGDDVITRVFSNESIDAGAGADVIDFSTIGFERTEAATIEGGDGDDTITGDAIFTTVYGGAGDDVITVSGGGGPVNEIYGGDGNDTLSTGAEPRADASSDSARFFGGAGDDIIRIVGPSDTGAAFREAASGGEGDDTIIMSSTMPTPLGAQLAGPIEATGDAGADTFRIEMQDGPFDSTDDDFATFYDGTLPFTFDAFEIDDFEPGIDRLIIDADAVTDGGVLAAGVLEESVDPRGDPETTLTFTYESTEQETTRFVITLKAGGVTWDDVVFEGEQDPVLSVA